jgi:CheY-like chemotaxis protein
MDGPSTLQAMRRIPSLAHTPIVFMTAKVQAHEIEEYKGLGAAGTIPKPFDPMTLADQVRRIWDDLEQLQH